MDQLVADSSHGTPRHLREAFPELRGKALGCFANQFQRPDHGIGCFVVPFERRQWNPTKKGDRLLGSLADVFEAFE
jgi:hypothetical protein